MPTGTWDPSAAETVGRDFEASLHSLGRGGSKDHLDPGFNLLRQSIDAYRVKAVALTAMGCRAAVETAGFAFLSHRRIGPSSWNEVPPAHRDGSPLFEPHEALIRFGYDRVVGELETRGILDAALKSAALRVRVDGDNIAHYSERKMRRAYTGILASPGRPWVQKNEATAAEILENLRVTSEILVALARADAWPGPE